MDGQERTAKDAPTDPHPVDFGTASAAKRGRNPKWPYVPIIKYAPHPQGLRVQQTEQIRKRAFATREEAVTYAQRVIDNRTAAYERDLADPRKAANREWHGLPRDLAGLTVTAAEPDETGQRPVGVVVRPTPEEREAATATFGLGFIGRDGYALVEWPDARCWHRPEEIRVVRPAN